MDKNRLPQRRLWRYDKDTEKRNFSQSYWNKGKSKRHQIASKIKKSKTILMAAPPPNKQMKERKKHTNSNALLNIMNPNLHKN